MSKMLKLNKINDAMKSFKRIIALCDDVFENEGEICSQTKVMAGTLKSLKVNDLLHFKKIAKSFVKSIDFTNTEYGYDQSVYLACEDIMKGVDRIIDNKKNQSFADKIKSGVGCCFGR